MRFLQQIRSRSTAVQQEHEALLAAAEESVRAARTAKVGPAPVVVSRCVCAPWDWGGSAGRAGLG